MASSNRDTAVYLRCSDPSHFARPRTDATSGSIAPSDDLLLASTAAPDSNRTFARPPARETRSSSISSNLCGHHSRARRSTPLRTHHTTRQHRSTPDAGIRVVSINSHPRTHTAATDRTSVGGIHGRSTPRSKAESCKAPPSRSLVKTRLFITPKKAQRSSDERRDFRCGERTGPSH